MSGNLMANPVIGVFLTLAAWAVAVKIRQALRRPLFHPGVVSIALLLLLLPLARIPYEDYNRGGQFISFFLGPAVVALAIPLYRQRAVLRRHAAPVLAALCCGCVAGIVSAYGIAVLLHASRELALSLAPKSVTTPFAIEIVKANGGIAPLTAAIVIFTGMIGAAVGPEFLRGIGIRDRAALGLGIGTATHAMGTSRLIEENEVEASFSSVAMALNGPLTALVLPYLLRLISSQ